MVQGIWKYIKEHDLQDPTNKRVINCDAALQTLLGAPSTDMFQLNKLLKPHIHTIPGACPLLPPLALAVKCLDWDPREEGWMGRAVSSLSC